jgi:pyridoxal phosphate enzyme (YggS family)
LPPCPLCATLTVMNAQVDVKANLARVRERIAAAARRAGRDPDAVTLVAVTKTHPPPVIQAAYQAGLRDFGENRVEEASAKVPACQELFSPAERPRWHMIGHLQRRKAQLAVALFDIIHSVDSLRLAQRINRFAEESGKVMPVLLEVNVSGEASKYGWQIADKAALFDDVEQIMTLSHLRPCGLMTMAPIVADPEQARPVFVALRALRDELSGRFGPADWRELSMGMTDDLEPAVEEGATMVRVGRAIFGSRGKWQY